MYKKFQARIDKLISTKNTELLLHGLKGIEKESLRVTPDGYISQFPHPSQLGSALTHPYITTDYSEALTELITPAFPDVNQTITFLSDLHHFVYTHLDDELFWATSMPCLLETEDSIPIAKYGNSNVGFMKHVYRRGLGYRYGRAMQTISGVHYNYSLPESFWPVYQDLEMDEQDLKSFVSDAYMGLIRNFQRIGWIVSYLFGASPSVCKTFIELRKREFEDADCTSCHEPHATSLRMSDLGYKNKNQDGIQVSYNSLLEYVDSLRTATTTSVADYEKIGVLVNGEYRQLNTSRLQIENEYYSFVRPKQIALSGEAPSHALEERGVKYVEIRALDVNPFDSIGVNEQQLHFMEMLLIYCLLQNSPPMDADERATFEHNQSSVACGGRNPEHTIIRDGKEISVKIWAKEILGSMQILAEIMTTEGGPDYQSALREQILKVEDNDRLPSSRVMQGIEEHDGSYFNFALAISEKHKNFFMNRDIPQKQFQRLQDHAIQSINEQQAIQSADTISFDAYLQKYFGQ